MASKSPEIKPVNCVLIGEKDSEKHKIINFYKPQIESMSGNKEHTIQMVDNESKFNLKISSSKHDDSQIF